MRVRRYGCGGGAGRRRGPGGEGIERDLEMLEDVTVSLDHRAARRRSRGASPAASRARSARTGCCPAATRRAPSACADKCTVPPRTPATSCACARPAAAAGAARGSDGGGGGGGGPTRGHDAHFLRVPAQHSSCIHRRARTAPSARAGPAWLQLRRHGDPAEAGPLVVATERPPRPPPRSARSPHPAAVARPRGDDAGAGRLAVGTRTSVALPLRLHDEIARTIVAEDP